MDSTNSNEVVSGAASRLPLSYAGDYLHQLSADALGPLAIFTSVAGIGVVLFGSAAFAVPWQGALTGLVLTLVPISVAVLLSQRPRLGLCVIVVSWTFVLLVFVLLLPHLPIAYILVFPVVLATFLVGWQAGLAIVGGTLGVLGIASHVTPGLIRPPEFLLQGLLMVSTFLACWVSSRSARDIACWYRQNYAEACERLEEARAYQGELNQALKDLAVASVEMVRLNQILDAARWQAEEAQRAKAEFAANVSHELRTPLNIIIGFSEAILNAPVTYGTSLPPPLLADVAAIYRNSQHLSQLINDVLDLSQVESNRLSLNRQWESISEIIEEATLAVQPAVEARGLYLTTHIPSDVPPVYCDRTRIRQVILNLLGNANRFTDSGGITVDVSYDSSAVTVSVTDTGVGIAEDDLPKLFEPFRQLDGSISRRQGGSGLGLSISRGFVELHGGQIGVRSRPGIGTTVWFSLPLNIGEPQLSNPARWIVPGWNPRRRSSLTPDIKVLPRIIVLEPSDLLYSRLSRYLDEVEIRVVSTIEELESEIERHPAQVVLIRGESPEQTHTWLTAANQIRSQVPLVACTLADPRLNGYQGIEDYLLKPITPGRLLQAIQAVDKPIRSILLVEDDPDTLQLFTRILTARPHRYRVLQATHGREALQLMQLRRPDLLLLDIMMPGMDGLTVLAEKNRNPQLKDIPVLILSATDPSGQPTVAPYLQATRTGGLSLPEIVRCAVAIGQALVPLRD